MVKPRVVLTAGHMVFNDRTLTFMTNVYWFPRRYAGQFEPRPVQPRGWYVFAGYDAQRAVDDSPGVSSPAAQQLDVAALYFYQDAVAGGGQSGYLVSDAGKNWLTGSEAKRLTGYPLDAPAPLDRQRRLQSFGLFTSPLAAVAGAPGVFTTGAFRSTGGNSGGALNVRFNSVFYPAGIYLGGTGQSVVRVIDRDVVDLINRAELTANTGDNNNSGGVPTGSGEGNQLPLFGGLFGNGGLAVRFDAAAVAAGAGWRFVRPGGTGDAYVRNNTLVTNRLTGLQDNLLEFTGVAGYLTPGRVSAPVLANTTQTVSVVYARALSNQVPRLLSGGQFRFDVSASSYGRYVVYGRTDLRTGTWVPLVTNTLDALGQHGFTNAFGTPFHFFYTGYLTNP